MLSARYLFLLVELRQMNYEVEGEEPLSQEELRILGWRSTHRIGLDAMCR